MLVLLPIILFVTNMSTDPWDMTQSQVAARLTMSADQASLAGIQQWVWAGRQRPSMPRSDRPEWPGLINCSQFSMAGGGDAGLPLICNHLHSDGRGSRLVITRTVFIWWAVMKRPSDITRPAV